MVNLIDLKGRCVYTGCRSYGKYYYDLFQDDDQYSGFFAAKK